MITVSRAELKTLRASEFAEGSTIRVRNYLIHIEYGSYNSPMRSWVQTLDGKILDCTPGARGSWPYYIADFISRKGDL